MSSIAFPIKYKYKYKKHIVEITIVFSHRCRKYKGRYRLQIVGKPKWWRSAKTGLPSQYLWILVELDKYWSQDPNNSSNTERGPCQIYPSHSQWMRSVLLQAWFQGLAFYVHRDCYKCCVPSAFQITQNYFVKKCIVFPWILFLGQLVTRLTVRIEK